MCRLGNKYIAFVHVNHFEYIKVVNVIRIT
jgi:hypothetical protein